MNQAERQRDSGKATDDALAQHRDALKQRFPLPLPTNRPNRRSTAKTALLLIAALAVGVIWQDPVYRTEEYSSALGQLETIALADGSSVTLDAASRIKVSWHLRTRQVELLSGQVLFDVAKAQYRPFLTLAGDTRITVLGTRYSVHRQQQDVHVAVAEGAVSVRSGRSHVQLGGGSQVRVSDGQLGAVAVVDGSTVSGWAKGRLVFDRTPLAEVLDALRRHKGIRIQLTDPTLAALPVSGSYYSNQLDNLPTLLPKVLPVTLSRNAQGALQLSRTAREK